MPTPRSLGYRLPAEWEPQAGVWLSWPNNRSTWTDCWEQVQMAFAQFALQMSQNETVYVNLEQGDQSRVEKVLDSAERGTNIPRGNLKFFDHPTNDAWLRDYGPIYLKHQESGVIALTDWQFNGWGEKYPFELDNLIPKRIAETFGITCFSQPIVLEGGAVEGNGNGDLLVTPDCLLHQNRNPEMNQEQIESKLRDNLGVDKIHWLTGCIEGDDTDGHIDNLARFYKSDGILLASEQNSDDDNFDQLGYLKDQLNGLVLENGNKPDLVALPMPDPVFEKGKRLPLSYLNFFIGNAAVYAPVFGQTPKDSEAMEILAGVFQDRELKAIDCRDLIREGGALHCLTQPIPKGRESPFEAAF